MQPTALRSNDFTAPAVQGHVRPSNLHVAVVATEDEYAWLGKVKTAADKSIMNGWISWSAYYADSACVVRVDLIPSPSFNRSMLKSNIDIEGATLENVDHFAYLGSYLSKSANIDVEIQHRIRCACFSYGRLKDRVF